MKIFFLEKIGLISQADHFPAIYKRGVKKKLGFRPPRLSAFVFFFHSKNVDQLKSPVFINEYKKA